MLIFILSAPAVDTPEAPDFPAPPVSDGALPESLRKRFRARELADRREELGLPPLRLVSAAGEAEPVTESSGDLVAFPKVGELIDLHEGEEVLDRDELEEWVMGIQFELGDRSSDDDDDDQDDDETVPEPTPLAPPEAVVVVEELEYASV